MKAIEIISKTDHSGHLKIDYQLDHSNSEVRILILLQEETTEQEEENLWINSISKNPVFDFLNDPTGDIYSLEDGEAIQD
ncbi:MAG TPA: hypothetical protein VFI78_05045 [Salinimicrobium sp.]|nr:hypothetical protein [Salinimicrobium sp.]